MDIVKKDIISNDVWIGRDVHMTPVRTIADGYVIVMRSVLTKTFLHIQQ